MGGARFVLLLCLLALMACQAQPSVTPPEVSPSAGASAAPGPADPASPPPAAGAPDAEGARGQGIGPTPGRSPGARGTTARRLDDLAPLGTLCRDYLRARRVVVEIDWTAGSEPSPGARAHLLATLRRVVAGEVVEAGGTEVAGAEREVWTTDELRATAAAHRAHYSAGDGVALYVLSVGGRFEDEAALGVAHRASEFAMFPGRISGLSALLGGREAVERAVLVHEAGHLLCLLNLGYTSPFAREDAEHPKHSSDRASVMHWAIDSSAVGQLFNGPPPDSFTAQDLADLEGLRTGKL